MNVAIIKYNAGNLYSVDLALQRIGITATITDNPVIIQQADKVIFPGVGEASSAMQYLKEKNLDTVITNLKQPVLGICLGMQLLCSHSEEGDTKGLGIFNHNVVRFQKGNDKIPHVGWNTITNLQSPLFKNIDENTWFYFVHSYYAEQGVYTTAITDYNKVQLGAALHKNNFYGVQFHPEKSGDTGQCLLKNFINL